MGGDLAHGTVIGHHGHRLNDLVRTQVDWPAVPQIPTLPRLPDVPDPLRRIRLPDDLEAATTLGVD